MVFQLFLMVILFLVFFLLITFLKVVYRVKKKVIYHLYLIIRLEYTVRSPQLSQILFLNGLIQVIFLKKCHTELKRSVDLKRHSTLCATLRVRVHSFKFAILKNRSSDLTIG